MVLIPPGEKDFSLLLRQADLALAAAKRAGGGRLVAYRRSIRDDGADAGFYFGEAPAAAGSAKSFNENMFYLFFNMLYEGEDPDRAVDLVLRTAGQHFHVSRAYIYEAEPEDRQVLRLTHEWCDEETESLGRQAGDLFHRRRERRRAGCTRGGLSVRRHRRAGALPGVSCRGCRRAASAPFCSAASWTGAFTAAA